MLHGNRGSAPSRPAVPALRVRLTPPAIKPRIRAFARGLPAGLLVLALAALFASAVQAQTVRTLVSNTSQATGGASANVYAQKFTTGANASGYTLSSVSIWPYSDLTNRSGTYVTVKGSSGGEPGALVASLNDPGGVFPGTSDVAFSAPSNTVLAPNTDYWVVVNENQSDKLTPGRTASNNEDAASLDDWSIADGSLRQDAGGNGSWLNEGDSLFIDVQGYANLLIAELSISGGSVLEGENAIFTVSLEYALPDAATVQYSTSIAGGDTASSDDFTAATAQTLTIPAGSTSATISIATTDDTTTEDNETFTVTLSNPSSNARLGTVTTATATILANDAKPEVSIAGATGAEGTSLAFTVSLTHSTGSDVTVQYSTSIAGGDTASANDFTGADDATLTIAAGDTSETISIAAIQDARDEDDETFTLTISNPSSNAVLGSATSATGTIEDDDTNAIVLSQSPLEVPEGGSADYAVVLAAEPASMVTIDLSASVANVLTFSSDQLTFTTSNWDQSQTVTLTASHDDDTANENVNVMHDASGGGYGSLDLNLPVEVVDDDEEAILVSASTTPLPVPEGGSATFTLALGSLPDQDVTLTLAGLAGTDFTVGDATLEFTTSNWDTAQTVTVSAAADLDTDDDQATLTITAASADSGYQGITESLALSVADTVIGEIELSTNFLQVLEFDRGTPPSYRVRLSLRPSAAVTMTVNAVGNHDLSIGTTQVIDNLIDPPGELTFTRNNWSAWRTVYVYSDIDFDDAHDNVTLRHTTEGGGYDSAQRADLQVLVEDDDADKGWVTSPNRLSLDEGQSGEYRVKLRTRPSANVDVAITGGGGALTLKPGSLTFTRGNWNTHQTVSVTAATQVSAEEARQILTHTGSGGGYGSIQVDPLELPVTIARDAAGIASGGVSVTSSPLDSGNTYARDETIALQVGFDRNVTVDTGNGTPHIEVDVGSATRNFEYAGMNGSTQLRFEYKVQAGDLDSDGISIGNGALALNGGTIKDASNQRDANVWGTRLSTQTGHRVDGGQTLAAAALSSLEVRDNGTAIGLTPSFSAGATSYTAAIAATTSMVTVEATAAEGGSATVLPADASDTDTGHQVLTDGAATEITINVTRPPRPAGSYSVTLNKTIATVNLSAGASPVAYHLEDEAAEFTVTLDQALDTPLDVNLTMTQTQRFLPNNRLSQRVRIPANQTSGTLSLDAGDLTGGATSNGKLTASIASNAAYSIGTDSSAEIDLIAADPVIAVRPASAGRTFLEDAGTVEIGLVAEAVPGVSIPGSLSFGVSAQTAQGTAVGGLDFSHLNATGVSFAASDFAEQGGRQRAAKSVSVDLIDDSDQEGDEYFFLQAVGVSLPDGVELTQYDGSACSGGLCLFRVDILDDESAPAQVSGLVLTPGGGSLAASWTQVTGADGYKVQWKSGSETFADAADDGRQAVVSSGSTTSYTIPSLTDGTDYTVRVIATRGSLDGPASSEVSESPDKPILSIANGSAAEGSPVQFAVSLSRAIGSAVTVGYATSIGTGDTASADDFTAASGETLTIAAGDTGATFTIATADDTDIEPDETFTVTLSSPSANAALSGTPSATGTIQNNDASAATVSQLAFTSVPTSGHYGPGDTIELSATFSAAVDVTGAPRIPLLMDGTPAADSYALYDAGASSGTVLVFRRTVTAADDDDSDGIAVAANALELNGGTIVNDGATVAAVLNHAALTGGQVRTRVITNIAVTSAAAVGAPAPVGIYGPGEVVEFTVTFSEPVLVNLTGTPTLTFTASDSGQQQASYDRGSNSSALVFSWTVPNNVPGAETPIGVPSNVGGSAGLQLNGGGITDSSARAVNLRHPAYTTAAQADTTAPILPAGPGAAVIDGSEVVLTFERGGGLAEHLNETSEPGTGDFIVRDSNNSSTSVTGVDVAGAKVTLTLSSPAGHAQAMTLTYQGSALKDLWGNALGTFTNRALRNDSPEPALSITDFSVDEDDGNAVFRVNVDVPSGEAATVEYATSDGTAIGGSDYTATSGTLSIPANRAFANIQVPIADDTVAEQDETFNLTLSNASNATIADNQATATIVDNEGTPVLSIADASAEEGEAVEFTVSLSLAAGQTVTVQYDTSIGASDTASADDFTAAAAQTLSIPAGDTSATISIPTVEDTTEESDETFTLTLSNASSNAEIDSQAMTATGAIENDDVVPARVTNVSFANTPGSGSYGLGDMIELRVRFDRDVEVFGAPRVQMYFLDNHRFHEYALYDADASSDRVLVFKRQVTGRDDNDGTVRVITDGLQLNKGAIRNKGTSTDARLGHARTDGPGIATRWVEGIALTSTPAVSTSLTGDPVYGAGETLRFKVTFKHAVEVDETGGSPIVNFNFGDASTTYAAAYESGSGTAELTFGWTVPASVAGDGRALNVAKNIIDHSGATEAASGLAVGGGAIENSDGVAVNIRHTANGFAARTDTTAPSLLNGADGATVDGDTLTLTFKSAGGIAEILDGDSAPAASDFSVSVDGTARTVTGVDVDGAEVELALASAVGHAQTVTVGYTPGTDALQDLWDQAAADFTNRAVRNDSPEPVLSIEDVTVAEDGAAAVFTVSLDVASGETVTVNYATADDTAVAGSDYTAANGALTFDPGDLSETFSVSISDDSVGEGSEAFTVNLSNASNASIGDGAATGTITDNEQMPTLSIADASAAEGSPVAFTVSLSPVAAGDVTVGYATTDGTATTDANHADGADYTAPAASASLTILAGQGSATISIPTGDDTIHEPDETFTLTLSGPSSNAVLGTAKTATGTIENNDTASADATLASLTAKVDGSAIALTPVFASGTHSYRADVANTVASVTVEAAATHSRAGIAISDDDDSATPNEAVLGLAFGENTVTVTVTAEDDTTQDYTLVIARALPKIGWDANQYKAITEDSGDVELLVFLRPASDGVVEVDYATSPRSGSVAGEDYVHTSGNLRFEPGETEKTVTVTILDDTIYEPNGAGDLQVTLSNLNGTAEYGQYGPTLLMLMGTTDLSDPENDEPPTASMEDVSVDEDAGTMTFVLSLSHQVEAEVTYQVSSFGTGGTATASEDYERFLEFGNAEIELSPKQSSANFVVTILDDAIDEEDETITFDWRRQGPTATNSINVTGTIVDNDTRGVSVSTDALNVPEGGSDSYDVVLESEPTGTVTVTPTVTGSPDVTLNATVLTFTDSNWDMAQTVTVSAAQDTDAIDDEASIAHAVAGADYGANGVTAGSVAVTVDDDETPPVLDLAVSAVTGDDTVNIAEKAAGFSISGNTGSEPGVGVSVAIGTDTLTATSSDDGNGTAVWSVDVPADAAYITGASLNATVSASKTGFTDPADIVRTLSIDLTAPTAPTYSPPTSLKVGEAIATMNPTGGADIDGYAAEGLPSGLEIDDSSGAITGTPDTADANTSTATVTVTDTAGNTAEVDIAFPAVDKGVQTLTGFRYSAASMTLGTTAPTVTAPTGARTAVSYTAQPATVCSVDRSTGALTIIGLGDCVVTATAEADDDYEAGIATFTVAVQSAGNLVLNLDDIAADNTVNIAEKAAGFTISGNTGSDEGVDVSVQIASQTPLTATSADDGNGTATWSVDVPADAAYIAGSSVQVTVSASKIGYTDAANVVRTLAIDLAAPTAPTYTPPTSLKVGEAIAAMNPSGGADIAGYAAEGLPSGLEIDDSTGVITGTPDTADASTATATVTVTDTAGNTAEVDIAFPAVDKGVQTLTGFRYSAASMTFGTTVPTVTAPTGEQTAVRYSADPPEVCTVNAATGELTIVGLGDCVITATAQAGDDYEQGIATFTVAVQSAGNLVLNLDDIADDDTVNIAKKAAGFSISGNTGSDEGVDVSVQIASQTPLTATSADDGNGTATWSVDVPADAAYIAGSSVQVTVSASKTGYTDASDVVRTLAIDLTAPTAPTYTPPTSLKVGEAITAMNPTGGADIAGYSAAGLPSGLEIDDSTGVITGTPDTADANTSTATVTVTDTAGNTAEVDVTFPAVAKGVQTLTGFRYSAASMTLGTTAPTVTAPTGARTAVSYTAQPATVCSVDQSTGALTVFAAGDCVITATAEASDDYDAGIATFTVAVQSAGNLVLNLDVIAGDNTVNIAEKAAGFSISGDTGTEAGVGVSVQVGSATPLTATSADDGNGTATWSVDVPADAAYIAGSSVQVTVSASKIGYTDPADVVRALAIDLAAPTAPTYTPPTSLKVGEAIATMNPTGGADIDGYAAEGLPSGLEIDDSSGAITGTPDTADASTATATVTVTDTAGNTAEVDIAFPAVDKGVQTLTGFRYSAASMTFGTTVPTVTAPTGAQTTVRYSADPPEVCTVNAATGELTIIGLGNCVVTATAEADDDYEAGIATFTVAVQALGNLVLNLDDIAEDDTVNIAEKAAGFTISGNTGSDEGVDVSVQIASQAPLTATSADDGNGTATWSVDVPANATYITGASVPITVSASRTGFTAPPDIERSLTIDLTPPTAPSYTPPTSLKVGEAMAPMSPSGGANLQRYSATGLPSGLGIDSATGVIGGTPDTADAGTSTATVTFADAAGNTASVDIVFPAVATGDQSLTGFRYSADSATLGSAAPTLIAPTGALTTPRYAATPATVCTVDNATGALTLVGIGICRITVTAAGTTNYNAATETFTLTVESSGPRSTAVALSAEPSSIGEGADSTGIVLTGTLNGSPRSEDTTIAITVGAEGDLATEGADYAEVDDLELTIPAGQRSGRATLVLSPAADFMDETDETVSIAGTSGIEGFGVTGTTLLIADDDERGVAVSVAALTVPEGLSSMYTVVLESQPTGAVTVTPLAGEDAGVTLDPPTLTFTTENWNDAQPVTVAATQDDDTEDGSATVDHAVSGADYASVEVASVAVTVTDSGMPSTAVLLGVDADTVAEDAGAAEVTVTVQLDRAPRTADTRVTVSVGAAADSAMEGRDYAAVADLVLTIPAGEASAQATFTLEPTDDTLIESDEALSVWGAANATDLNVIGTAIAIRDDDSSNDPPVFPAELPRVIEVAENTESEAAIGPPLAATDADGHKLTYALVGPDAIHFTIDPASGQLGTLAVPDHETKARHSFAVTAEDGHGGRARLPVTVTVTDVDEQPGTPDAPAVLATPGSTDSLELHWSAPDRNGGPAIVGYTVQYREGDTGSWTNHRHVGTNTRATVTRLTAATAYQARVRALNGEIAGEWSDPGAGRTGTADNEAPVFDADLQTLLTVEENTAAGMDLGEPFGATDADGDTLAWMLEGPDRRAFAIDRETGQLRTLAALDHESKASHAVTVRADDGNGGSARLAVTVTVTDVEEQPGTPLAPLALAARSSTTSLEVNWNAPARNGGPTLAGYDLQYRSVTEDDADGQDGNQGQDGQPGNGDQGRQDDAGGQGGENNPGDVADESDEAAWIDYRHIGTSTRAVIPWLDPAASYEVRVRALNGEIAGEWSEPGAGRTGVAANMPPVFDSGLPTTLTVDENTTAGAELGAPFAATDADGDTLTWLLDGAAASAFEIDSQSGQLRTLAALDHEDMAVRSAIVRVSDGRGGADELRVRVEVRDVDEQAPTLSAPRVLATADSTTGLDLRWSAPARGGGPAIAGYEVQYRAGTDGEWIDLVHEEEDTRTSEDTRTTIAELESATDYQARVRALNGEIAGEWSEPGAGRTGTADNTAPAFDAGLPASLTVEENTRPGTELGAPFAATDTDGDTLTWLLDGADRRAFAIDPDNGQIRTRAALDHEAQAAFALAVRVSDGAGGADTIAVTVSIADLDEQPAQPAPPWVLSSVDAAMSLDVRWTAPDANGGPAIAGYEVQYRAGADGEWTDHVREDGSETQTAFVDTHTAIADLEPETDYQVRVRALNGETPSEWSAPGAGNTARPGNSAPEFADDASTRSVPEDSEAGDPVGAPVAATDADRDRLTYFLEGADAADFDIDPYTGQIRTRAALDFEAKASHAVTVTANDGNGGADTIDVTIELVDAQEAQAVLGPAAPTGVTLARALSLDAANVLQAELTLRWDAPQAEDGSAAEIAWIEFRLGRYPESGNGLAAPAFQCAGNRPFEADGWRRIPDSETGGANARAWRFDASALGCHVLPDTFELRAQVRAVAVAEDGKATAASAPSTEARMRDEAPRVAGVWLDAAAVDELEAGDDLVFSVAFTEPVRVTAADGSPTLDLQLGDETRQATFSSAAEPPLFRNYGSGHIGSRLRFRYELQDGDDPTAGIVVPADAIALAGGAAIMDATGPGGHAAELRNAATTIAEGATVVATAGQASLTASFETDSVPEDHDGETAFTVQVRFDESASTDGNGAPGQDESAGDRDDQPATATPTDIPGLSLSEESFLVSGGRLTDLSRLAEGENHLWSLNIEPDSMGDVSISLGPTLDCAAAGAVCTSDGRKLANNIHAVVKGPPTLSVADARVAEAPDATMDFVVTLSRTLTEAVSVDYATADGTAAAGEDYTETFGTLTFEAGETAMTVSVPVLDDAHDDDGERFTLTLSNPSGGNAYLDDDTATGIIENSDPMPRAWIARFGRTVSDHVIGAIQARFRDDRRESQLTLGGLRVDGLFARWNASSQFADTDREQGAGAGAGFGADPWSGAPAFGRPTLAGEGFAGTAGNFATDGQPGAAQQNAAHTGRELPNLRQLLMDSSFFWSNADGDQVADPAGAADPDNRRLWSAWGNVAATRFQGEDGPLSLDGEVATAMVGVDASRDRWLAGVVLARSEGEGGYAHRSASGGSIASTLTSLHPFAQYRFSARTSAWGTIGYGVGDLSLTPEGAPAGIDTDLDMAMAAFGGRSVLSVRTGQSGSFELAVRSDASLTRTESGASQNLLSATGATSRLRLILEGSGSLPLGNGTLLTPTLEAGLRHDGGDAETGAGLEIGGGLGYSVGRLTAELTGRMLVAHEDAAYEDWGFGGSIRYEPAADGQGLKLSLGSAWGPTQSAVQSMWAQDVARGFAGGLTGAAGQRFDAEIGYGLLSGRRPDSLWTPFLAVQSADGGHGAARFGLRLDAGPDLEASLEIGARRDTNGLNEHAIAVQGRYRW